MLKHLWAPVLVLGFSGAAGMMRIMRANLLDELKKPYVVTARAKGVRPARLILKYPVRLAINPFISTLGWMLPMLFSGSAIISVVLDLPTTGPLLLEALQSQDMYLAGSFVLILSSLTVIGTLLSDLLLAVVDPRIKYE
jgi:peptide/nickel transport system permease protein